MTSGPINAEKFGGEGSEVLQNVEIDARNAFGSFTWLDVGLLVTATAAVALPFVSAVRPEAD